MTPLRAWKMTPLGAWKMPGNGPCSCVEPRESRAATGPRDFLKMPESLLIAQDLMLVSAPVCARNWRLSQLVRDEATWTVA